MNEQMAFSVAQFCAAHGFTKVTFYKLLKEGRAPRIMKVGTRTLVSVEAADDWRRECETNAELMEPRRGRRAKPLTRENPDREDQPRQAEKQQPPARPHRRKDPNEGQATATSHAELAQPARLGMPDDRP